MAELDHPAAPAAPLERTDNWSRVEGPERVEHAAARLALLGNSAAELRVRRRWLEVFAPRPGEMIIDVGAGSGIVTAELARAVAPGGRIAAVDPSAGLLDHAKRTMREAGVGHLADYRVADGRALPFGAAAFDAAVCRWVLLHVDRPGALIAEMKRVTRRGGRVLSVELDWDTMTVSPGERALTRRILHHAADRNLDPWIGRRLAGLYGSAGFDSMSVGTVVLTDRGADDRVWLDFLVQRADIALDAGVIVRDEHSQWTGDLADAFEAGTFFFSVTQFVAMGRLAP